MTLPAFGLAMGALLVGPKPAVVFIATLGIDSGLICESIGVQRVPYIFRPPYCFFAMAGLYYRFLRGTNFEDDAVYLIQTRIVLVRHGGIVLRTERMLQPVTRPAKQFQVG
jgi:hypothetical protein